MFKLLTYFSISSALAIALVTVVLISLFRQNAIHDLVEFGEGQNEALARAFSNSIWPKYSAYVAATSGMDGDALRATAQ